MFRLTACLSTRVSTPYNSAISRANNTFSPRKNRIFLTIIAAGTVKLENDLGSLGLTRLIIQAPTIEFGKQGEVLNIGEGDPHDFEVMGDCMEGICGPGSAGRHSSQGMLERLRAIVPLSPRPATRCRGEENDLRIRF